MFQIRQGLELDQRRGLESRVLPIVQVASCHGNKDVGFASESSCLVSAKELVVPELAYTPSQWVATPPCPIMV